MMTGLLKSNDKPAGWELPELLRQLLLEVDAHALSLEVEGNTTLASTYDQIAGKLRDAYGLSRSMARPMRMVRGSEERGGLEVVR